MPKGKATGLPKEHGHEPATPRAAPAAIAFVHRNAGLDGPCASSEVKRALRNATHKAGKRQKQAEGLTADALAAIGETLAAAHAVLP